MIFIVHMNNPPKIMDEPFFKFVFMLFAPLALNVLARSLCSFRHLEMTTYSRTSNSFYSFIEHLLYVLPSAKHFTHINSFNVHKILQGRFIGEENDLRKAT